MIAFWNGFRLCLLPANWIYHRELHKDSQNTFIATIISKTWTRRWLQITHKIVSLFLLFFVFKTNVFSVDIFDFYLLLDINICSSWNQLIGFSTLFCYHQTQSSSTFLIESCFFSFNIACSWNIAWICLYVLWMIVKPLKYYLIPKKWQIV